MLAQATPQFTGAEIEATFVDAMHEAYAEGREPNGHDLTTAAAGTVPLARLMDSQITALRQWSAGRAREAAARSVPPNPPQSRPRASRRLELSN